MKAIFLTLALSAFVPALALAQADPAAKPVAKAAAKAKAPVAKTEAKPKAKVVAKKEATSSRTQLKSAAKNVAAGIEAAEAAMTPTELAIAERVYVGVVPCELGNSVSLAADPKSPGYFNVTIKTAKYRMYPVVTSTGAIRLEDEKNGAVWLQLANKSMLMNHKLGQRLADECMSPDQVIVAEAIRKNPPPSVLDALPPATATK